MDPLEKGHHPEQLLINEVQLLLAEKRTYYSMMRAAGAVFTLPLSVIAFLVGTKEYHGVFNSFWVAFFVVAILLLISTFGVWLFYHSWQRINQINKFISVIKNENKRLAEIIL